LSSLLVKFKARLPKPKMAMSQDQQATAIIALRDASESEKVIP